MVKKLTLSLIMMFTLGAVRASTSSFARGADISWCTEMEADGKKFYNTAGTQTDIFALMKEIGMTAIRLRVWVNPSAYGYGAWCDKADVVAKAKRAAAQGLDLMIDFHYSDFFADPGTQTKPQDWSGNSTSVKQALVAHTTEVLQALQDEGIEPKWVQVGNETNSGMVWDNGKIDWNKTGSARFTNYVELSNAGYDAVKAVFPNAYVIVHIGGAYNVADYDCWFFTDFKNAGGKFDMIGLSHYPDTNDWASTTSGTISNYNAAAGIQALGEKFNVPVMICETGFSSSNPTTASAVMTDLFDRMTDVSCCAGIFYWEPEVYGGWKPSYYTSLGWGAYGMGAFSNGKPTAALDAFKGSDVTSPDWYLTGDFDLWGMSVAFTQSTTNPDVFTIDNYTVNAADLDQYGFFKFHVVSANWTENYVYNANISTLGTYTLMTAGSDGAWDNVYCTAMTTGKTYRLTWNRNTHEFTITSRQLGDVDNDGIVNVSDLTALINYILGTTPADFVIENANVNGEGVIDVSDITALINLILQ